MVVVADALLPVVPMAETLAVVAVEATAAVADLAEAPAPRTRVSRARTLATDSPQVSHDKPMHRVSAMRKHRESTVNNSAKTRAVRA